jgi:hypothetical protein
MVWLKKLKRKNGGISENDETKKAHLHMPELRVPGPKMAGAMP